MNRALTTALLSTVAVLMAGLAAPSLAEAEGKNLLTIEYPKVGQVCLKGGDLTDLKKRLKGLIIPEGAAITIISYSDSTEFATKGRFEGPAGCVKRAVPRGIGNHERLSTLRALQITETADTLGIEAFGGTPLLLLGADDKYRQRDSNAVTIVARRSSATGPQDRRVEVWATDGIGTDGGAAVASSGTMMLTPILLPPSSYYGVPAAAASPVQNGDGGQPVYAPQAAAADWQPWFYVGWAMVGTGVASAVAGTFILIRADDTSTRANDTLDVTRSIALERQAAEQWQSGGWAVGLGAGMTVFGSVLLFSLPGDPEPAPAAAPAEGAMRLVPSTDGQGGFLSLEGSF